MDTLSQGFLDKLGEIEIEARNIASSRSDTGARVSELLADALTAFREEAERQNATS